MGHLDFSRHCSWAFIITYYAFACLLSEPPVITSTPKAQLDAKERLAALGAIEWQEIVVILTIILLIGLWIGGKGYNSIESWWRIGFILSVCYIAIYAFAGASWWMLLGYF